MEIKLLRTFISNLHLDAATESAPAPINEELKMVSVFRDEIATEFVMLYHLRVPLQPGTFILSCEYSAVFETTETITEAFKTSHFPRVNAAAVGYPYLRAFVSQFSALAGFDIYRLPVRNFVKAEKSSEVPLGVSGQVPQ